MSVLDQLHQDHQRSVCAAIEAAGDMTAGGTLKHTGLDQWAVIHPDPAEPGNWRMTKFDARGFFGHGSRNSNAEAVRSAVEDGFRVRDDSALERLHNTPAFIRGNFVSEQIALSNKGLITWAQFVQRLADYDAQEQSQ